MALVSQNMNLDYIRTFVILAQSKTMTEASNKLGVGTSYVSRHVRALEEELDVKLLLLTPKNKEIKLTEDGKYFYEKYEKIYHEILLTEKQFKQSKQLDNCKLTIGINLELEESFLKEKIKVFLKKYPNVCIKIVNETSEALVQGLLQLKYDFIIDNKISENDLNEQITTKILVNSNYCILTTGVVDNVWDIPFILPVNGSKIRKDFDDYFKIHGISPKIKLEINNYSRAIDYAMDGLGAIIILKNLVPSNMKKLIVKDLSLKNNISISFIKEKIMPTTKEFLKLFELE